jgi:hypothetical protein
VQASAKQSSRHGLATAEPDPLRLVGTLVDGRYLVEAVVGSGGFGVVYRARHLQFDSPVALKVFVRRGASAPDEPDSQGSGSPPEGKLLFKLAPLHASFVRVYECGLVRRRTQRAYPYLAMEWLEGVTLKACLEDMQRDGRRLSLSNLLHLFDDLAQGLGVAHARRVAILIGLAVVAGPWCASAQSAAQPAAQALLDQGRGLMIQHRYEEACPCFAESHRLAPAAGTLLNLALRHELVGKTATAYVEYNDALALSLKPPDKARISLARQRISELKPKLSRLVVVVSEAQRDATIEVSLVCRLCAGLGIAVWAACQTLAFCRRLDGQCG